MGTFVQPTTLSEVLNWRAAGARVLSGGTDFWPVRVGAPTYATADETIMDLSRVEALRGISRGPAGWRIGACATWSQIAEAALPQAFAALQQAAREVGGRQIQNRGTMAGNLCNASPAADGVPPLLVLDASVELTSTRGRRVLPLSDFLLGVRRTALRPDEVLTAVLVPEPAAASRSLFLKLGARRYQLISIVMVAAVLRAEAGVVTEAAVAVGACAPVALRLQALEGDLIGVRLEDMAGRLSSGHFDGLAPIDDIRADAGYRRDVAVVLVRRALTELAAARWPA